MFVNKSRSILSKFARLPYSPVSLYQKPINYFIFKTQDNERTFKQSESKVNELISANVSLEQALKYDLKKLNPLKKFLDAAKLQTYQRGFYEDKTDPKRIYYYMRVQKFGNLFIFLKELNRQGNYDLAIDVYDRHKGQFVSTETNEIFHNKAMEQYHYAHNSKLKSTQEQLDILG